MSNINQVNNNILYELIDYHQFTKKAFLEYFLQTETLPDERKNFGLQKILAQFLNMKFSNGSSIKFLSYSLNNDSNLHYDIGELAEKTEFTELYITVQVTEPIDEFDNETVIGDEVKFKENIISFKFCDIPLINRDGLFLINGLSRIYIASFSRNDGMLISFNGTSYEMDMRPLIGFSIRLTIHTQNLYPLIHLTDKKDISFIEFMAVLFFDNIHQAIESIYGVKEVTLGDMEGKKYIVCFNQLLDYKVAAFNVAQDLFIQQLSTNQSFFIYDIPENEIQFINLTYNSSNYLSVNIISSHFYSLKKKNFENFSNKLELVRFKFLDRFYFEWGPCAAYTIERNLGENFDLENNNFSIEFLKKLYRYFILLNQYSIQTDDTISLSNKYIKPLSDYMYIEFRDIFLGLYSYMNEKAYSASRYKYLGNVVNFLQNSINSGGIAKKILNLFVLHPNMQFLDGNNQLSENIAKVKITLSGKGGINKDFAPNEFRNLHPSFFSKICCISTTEGKMSGLVRYIAARAKINLVGELYAPYLKHNSDEIFYVSSYQEFHNQYLIASHQDLKSSETNIIVKKQNQFLFINSMENQENIFYEAYPNQILSIGSYYTLPFTSHNNASRSLTAPNQHKQALILLKSQSAMVKTDFEGEIFERATTLRSIGDGVVIYVDSTCIKIEDSHTSEEIVYKISNIFKTNQNTCRLFKTNLKIGDRIVRDQIIAFPHNSDGNTFNIGTNLLTAVMPFHSFTYEDACIISEDCVKQDKLTSPLKTVYKFTLDYMNGVAEQFNQSSDVSYLINGIIREGTILKKNMILASKLTIDAHSNDKNILTSNKLLEKLFSKKIKTNFKIFNLEYPDTDGIVDKVEVVWNDSNTKSTSSKINNIAVVYISVVRKHRVQVGDKIAGRVGNKHIIVKILPSEDMPYTADGRRIELILNPLGMIGRMNKGQIFELHYSLIANKLGTRINSGSAENYDRERVMKDLSDNGFNSEGREYLYDGCTGERIKNSIVTGYMHILKLEHLSEKKFNSVTIAKYSLSTMQPVRGQFIGAQKIGHMELWTLQAYGVSHIIREKMGVLSDDIVNQNGIISYVMTGHGTQKFSMSKTLSSYISYLSVLGIKMNVNYVKYNSKK